MIKSELESRNADVLKSKDTNEHPFQNVGFRCLTRCEYSTPSYCVWAVHGLKDLTHCTQVIALTRCITTAGYHVLLTTGTVQGREAGSKG